MTGHVFVIQGDARRFACDAYLHATDRELRDGGGWTRSAPHAVARLDPGIKKAFQAEERFTLPLLERPDPEHAHEPATVLTAVPLSGVEQPEQIVSRLQEFFEVGAALAFRRGATRALSQRERPLLGVPLFGAGGGGGGAFRGDLYRVIAEQSRIAARKHDIDVAILLRDPKAYALAQMIRREDRDSWPELSETLRAKARDLGMLAERKRLVPFMGSGVSASAGAPAWTDLIKLLAVDAGVASDLVDELLVKHDVLDQAAYIDQEFKRRHGRNDFVASIIKAVDKRRYGLIPPLLGALDAEQAITLNYDQLFEWAAIDGQRPRRVIPGPADANERWLLKLHGSVTDPESIVLTRDDYLGFNADRAALSSLVKATLMTRHLLFVGFGMGDAHFHEIVHDVRRALPDQSTRFGTVLTLSEDPVTRRLWHDKLDFVHLKGARELEIFLDALLAFGATSTAYLLGEGYESTLHESDTAVRKALEAMKDAVPESARKSNSWRVVERALRELGDGPHKREASWDALPEGLD